jgi:hypothetical protein
MGHIDDSRDHKKQSEYRAALERDIEINKARKAKEREDQNKQLEWWEKVRQAQTPPLLHLFYFI